MTEKKFYVYILTNKINGTLYIGVTSDLVKRIWEHKNEVVKSFTKKHHLKALVYFELVSTLALCLLLPVVLTSGITTKSPAATLCCAKFANAAVVTTTSES